MLSGTFLVIGIKFKMVHLVSADVIQAAAVFTAIRQSHVVNVWEKMESMGRMRDLVFEKAILPLIVLVLTPAAAAIGSRLLTGEWLTWLKAIPWWVFVLFVSAIALWIIGGYVVRRKRILKERNLPAEKFGFAIPRWGYTSVGNLNYKGVVWRIRIPTPAQSDFWDVSEQRTLRVDIATPPHCPKCDTELEEMETFFGKYKWTCVRCKFSKKNDISWDNEVIRAKKLAQSSWENQSGRG